MAIIWQFQVFLITCSCVLLCQSHIFVHESSVCRVAVVQQGVNEGVSASRSCLVRLTLHKYWSGNFSTSRSCSEDCIYISHTHSSRSTHCRFWTLTSAFTPVSVIDRYTLRPVWCSFVHCCFVCIFFFPCCCLFQMIFFCICKCKVYEGKGYHQHFSLAE